ncbi:MAG TPA: dienelactone hydrolase family protein [Gemmatimonadales bacterium]
MTSGPLPPHAGQPVLTMGAPLDRARGAVIMVHGRNAEPRNILELVPLLGHPGFAFLAPAAAGRTWYPLSFLALREQNEPGISSGISVLHGLVRELAVAGIPQERVVLLGFSQGACLSSQYAAEHAGRYGGLILFSGGLIGAPGATWNFPGSFSGTPVFLGCSDVDSHVPAARVRESAAVFERMGAQVDMRIYAGMGHLVNEEEIAAARGILGGVERDRTG